MLSLNHNAIIIIPLVQIGLSLFFRPPPPPTSPTRVFSRQNSFNIEKTCELAAEPPPPEILKTVENINDPTPIPPSYYETIMNTSQLMRPDIPASCGVFACCSGRNCGCDKTVKFINKMKDKYVDIWIRPSSRFYLSGFGFKDIQGQIERTGPDEIIQNVRLPPGDVMEISVETFSYFISAAIDDQQLWFNRRFFTSNDIVFYERQLRRLKPMCKSFKDLIE